MNNTATPLVLCLILALFTPSAYAQSCNVVFFNGTEVNFTNVVWCIVRMNDLCRMYHDRVVNIMYHMGAHRVDKFYLESAAGSEVVYRRKISMISQGEAVYEKVYPKRVVCSQLSNDVQIEQISSWYD